MGLTDAQAMAMVEGLQVTENKAAAAQQIRGLYDLFVKCDCTMVEVGEGDGGGGGIGRRKGEVGKVGWGRGGGVEVPGCRGEWQSGVWRV